jgi:hypothetical protein
MERAAVCHYIGDDYLARGSAYPETGVFERGWSAAVKLDWDYSPNGSPYALGGRPSGNC